MAHVDDLDDGLAQLVQLFADVGLVANILRQRIASVDRLREPLKDELERVQALIGHVIPLL